MLYRFPNMVVAQLSRESVQQSIANGITAEQVTGRPRAFAHKLFLRGLHADFLRDMGPEYPDHRHSQGYYPLPADESPLGHDEG
eukprot:g23250.t1